MDRQVDLWDLATGKKRSSFKPEGGFQEFLPDGKGFATWDQDRVRFCDVNNGKQFAVTDVSPATYGPVSWGLGDPVAIPGTDLLAVPSGNNWKPGFFFQWCARLIGVKNLGKQKFESELAFLDTRTGRKVAAIELPTVGGEISPDGKILALPILEYEESTIEIWDIPPRKPLRWVLGLLAIPSVMTLITLVRIRQRFFRNRDRQRAVRGTAS
jgi:WD40 repeat protein